MHSLTLQRPTGFHPSRWLKNLALPLLALGLAGVTNAGASTLRLIPLLYDGYYGEYQMEGRAITPDGAYVVGALYQSNTVYNAWMDGFFYDVTNNTVIAPSSSGMVPAILTGVGYRTSGGQKQVVCDGLSGQQANWMTADGGATWGAKRRNLAFTDGKNLPVANSLGSSIGSDRYYALIGENAILGDQRHLYTGMGSGTWPGTFTELYFAIDNPDGGNLSGVAGTTGRAVGWYQDNYNYYPLQFRSNCVVEYPPPGPVGYPQSYAKTWFFNGLDGTPNGEAWSVSADGIKIFGRSPTPTDANWHGYKAIVGSGMNSWVRTDKLPDFPDTSGSTRLATPYGCTSDGRYAVGSNYRGYEKAVLWDTGSSNPNNWTVTDLTEVAAAEGLLGSAPNPRWISLVRAYSVGTDSAGNPVVTGFGVYSNSAGVWNRAFAMTVSLCGSVATVGALATPVYDNATTVTVTGCSLTASNIRVYHDATLIGSAPGGAATVVVTVTPPSLVAGWVLKATQVVNGQESCLTTAASATVTTAANPPPVVVLTAPANNSTYFMPATIGLAATVTTNYNTINYVSFYSWGTNLIATIATPPYTYSWANVQMGTYSVSARVGYNSGSRADSAVSIVTVGPPSSGSALALVPPVPWATGPHSEARAISPDGKYAVGAFYTTKMGDGVGFFYDLDTGTVIKPSSNSVPAQQYPPNILTGIGYRTDPMYGKQLILDGMSGGYQANWSTLDGGATWGARRADSSLTAGFALPSANSLGATTGSSAFYTVIGNYAADINNQRQLYTCKGSGAWSSSTPCTFSYGSWFYIDNPDAGNMCGVTATGRAVGWYRDNWTYSPAQVKYNCVVEYPPPGSIGYPESYAKTWFFRGLANTNMGTAWSISADGTKIFGHSPTPTDSNWHGYKAVVTSAMNSLVGTPQKLPDFPDTAGSPNLATPYGCSADGRYAVGMNYRRAERAVLWDTGNANPANWTVLDLTDRAAAEGLLGTAPNPRWMSLTRGYSIGTNSVGNPVVAGVGNYYDGTSTYTRAFVMTVGTPRPRITSITGVGTGSVTVNYVNTLAGRTYTLQYSTNLKDWYPVSNKTATGVADSQADSPADSAQRYYRTYTP